MQDLSAVPVSGDDGLGTIRVLTTDGPLGALRLTVRAIARAEGYVMCRHGSLEPQILPERDWLRLPPAHADNFDL